MKEGLLYTHTNENLNSIVNGLNLKHEKFKTALAVGGSGDQAFAILEFVEKIEVYDINLFQINYIKEQIENIDGEKFHLFFQPVIRNENLSKFYPILNYKNLRARNIYFSSENHLINIKTKLKNVVIFFGDIIIDTKGKKYDVIYLSNILSWILKKDKNSLENIFFKISNMLNINGLLYIADLDIVTNKNRMQGKYSKYFWKLIPLSMRLNKIDSQEFLPLNLILDSTLTREAQQTDGNMQVSGVYRKINL